jgi:hypothetical protein
MVYWAKWNGEIEINKALTFKTVEKDTVAVLNRLEMYSPPNCKK